MLKISDVIGEKNAELVSDTKNIMAERLDRSVTIFPDVAYASNEDPSTIKLRKTWTDSKGLVDLYRVFEFSPSIRTLDAQVEHYCASEVFTMTLRNEDDEITCRLVKASGTTPSDLKTHRPYAQAALQNRLIQFDHVVRLDDEPLTEWHDRVRTFALDHGWLEVTE